MALVSVWKTAFESPPRNIPEQALVRQQTTPILLSPTLANVAKTASDTDNKAFRAWVEGTANLYRVMSLLKQGEKDEARSLFTATAAKMKPLPVDEKNSLVDDANHDDLILWMAYREAKDSL